MFVLKRAKTPDGDLTRGERDEACAWAQGDRRDTAGKAAEPEAAHERRHDDGDRVDVGTSEERQQPLPDDLIDKRGEAAQKEQE